ncbi:KUP/HAK/KT family potassium transporter, partial [Methylocella tundrae]|uniref:KUP/HAK/KT family potassium transporter n=1 Tax=Methylocella tundrae TaxID=227605 RepID=UPI001AEF149D
ALDFVTLLAVTATNLAMLSVALPLIMGRGVSRAARCAQASVALQALSWAAIIASSHLWDRALSTLSIGSAAAAQWALFTALQEWLGPRPGRRWLPWLVAVIPLGYALGFGDYAFRVGWANLLLAALLAVVARTLWPKSRGWLLPLCVVFFIIDLGFVIANGAKLLQGAWFPVVLGIFLFTMMRTWRRGRELLRDEIRKDGIRLDTFLPGLMLAPPVRVPGTAVFLT